MTRHLLKLIWNRRRSNLLLVVEILLSFVVTLVVVGLGVYFVDNYRNALGFTYADVWRVSITADPSARGGSGNPRAVTGDAATAESARRLLAAVRELPEVEAAALASMSAYDIGLMGVYYEVGGRRVGYELNFVSDDFAEVMRLEPVRGHWFSREDDAAGEPRVVVNERFAREQFGDEDPIGRTLPEPRARDGRTRLAPRVVGVVRDFRLHGEYDPLGNYTFERRDVAATTETPRRLILRLRPGTTRAFEETLMLRMTQAARDWSFQVQSLEELRAANHRWRLGSLLALAIVAGSLLLMVALGLTGVIWQNVTQRAREIGLRRAQGATSGAIQRQIVGEVLVLTTLALVPVVALALQAPLLGLTQHVPVRVLATSLLISIGALYALAALCGLHPARLAARVQPAEALHYD